ncbi:MAG: ABC transporter ATP-binding protein [Acidobacteria bacterium]|nr:ABC transporter ATP-binding protein [Acidobacteriota bacterium]
MLFTQALKKKFGAVPALTGLTMQVPEGSVYALVGPNGAGKSTAMKILLNMLRADEGNASVLGKDSRKLGPADLAQLAYVSESRRLPDWMSVSQFLAYNRRFYPSWDDDILSDLLSLYQLPLDRRLNQLSRGMRMQASLAAALCYRPRLIVLDEPFSGLDVLVREQLIESILDRTPELTVLLASHDLGEIESFATHVAYLNEGRIRFSEEAQSISGRFREIEVLLDEQAGVPKDVPESWLNPESVSSVFRFTHSRYEPETSDAEILQRFSAVREISVRALPLRSIFVALAKAAQARHCEG